MNPYEFTKKTFISISVHVFAIESVQLLSVLLWVSSFLVLFLLSCIFRFLRFSASMNLIFYPC